MTDHTCTCPDDTHDLPLGCTVAQLRDELDMTRSDTVEQTARNVAHLRD